MKHVLVAERPGHDPIVITGWRAVLASWVMALPLPKGNITYRYVCYRIGAAEKITVTIEPKKEGEQCRATQN